MRSLVVFAGILVSVHLVYAQGNSSEAIEFKVSVRTITAFVKGPIILEAEIHLSGKEILSIENAPPTVTAPKEWEAIVFYKERIEPGLNSAMPPQILIDPNLPTKFVFSIGHLYRSIPKGKAKLQLDWEIKTPARFQLDTDLKIIPEKRRTTIKTEIEIDVIAATSESIHQLADDLYDRVKSPQEGLLDLDRALNYFLYGDRPEFIPLGFALLDRPEMEEYYRRIYYRLFELFPNQSRWNRDGGDYLMQPYPRAGVDLIRQWIHMSGEAKSLPVAVVERLREAPHPLIRAAVYLSHPKTWDDQRTARLLDELRRYKQPVDAIRFADLLDRLDSDRFAYRMEAFKQLVSLKESALPAIEQALANQSRTPTQHQLLQRALKEIRNTPPDFLEREFINYLGGDAIDPKLAKSILTALSKGMPEAWLTRESTKRLRRIDSKK